MTDEDFKVRLIGALERIALANELMVAPTQTQEPEGPLPCDHPVDLRIDFGVTDGQPDWQCGVCKFRSIDVAALSAPQ